uniref:Uncharacterized protein n=2 Tax=root TaxID=1 RepID=A0A8S5UE38_9CAUD|nr:MAG TPA: hypothetical protein [Myoviridae sp. ct1AP5]
MIEQIINDIKLAYHKQLIKKDGEKYKIRVSPMLFDKIISFYNYNNLIETNIYKKIFIMGIPLTKDFTMNGLKWELCIVKNSKNYDDKLKERDFNIFLIDEIRKLYDKKFEEFLNEYLNRYSTGVKDNG